MAAEHPLDGLRIETLKDVADRGMGGRTLPVQAEGGVQPATVHLDEGLDGAEGIAAGDHGIAIACLERSARLDPRYPSLDYYHGYALAHFVAGEYEATIAWAGETLRQVPNRVASHRYLAASLGLLGRLEEGRQVVQRLLELAPKLHDHPRPQAHRA